MPSLAPAFALRLGAVCVLAGVVGSVHSCARCTSSLSSLSTTSQPFLRDSFACGAVRTGGVVDMASDGGGGIKIARTSIAQGQEGSAFLVETY